MMLTQQKQLSTTALQENLSANQRLLIRKANGSISTALAQLKDMQWDVYQEFKANKGKPSVLFTLARAFVMIQESIRITRGIPMPGQLRPDLDPVQMARMLKRAKKRQPIDVPSDIRAALKSGGKKSWQESPEEKSQDDSLKSPPDDSPQAPT